MSRPQRKTKQQAALRQVFEEAEAPLSVEELHERACKKIEGLGIATVYRQLRTLLEEEFILLLNVEGETFYERAGLGHHHHFRCNGCGKLFDLEGCPGKLNDLLPQGFKLESHEITLFGRCASCA